MRQICQRCVRKEHCMFLNGKAPEACPSVRAYDLGVADQQKVAIDKACKFVREICDGKRESNWKYDLAEQLKEYMNH